MALDSWESYDLENAPDMSVSILLDGIFLPNPRDSRRCRVFELEISKPSVDSYAFEIKEFISAGRKGSQYEAVATAIVTKKELSIHNELGR